MNDTQTRVRIATPSDGEGLRGMFARSSSETVRRRFRIPHPKVPPWMVAFMLKSDPTAREALVAVAGGEIVGHATYVKLEDDREAEMAVVVEDGWQLEGVGRSLLSELARRARLGGVETFTGEVLPENRPMLGLAAIKFAGTGYAVRDGAYHVRMPLGTLGPAANGARTLRRAA